MTVRLRHFYRKNDLGELSDNLKKKTADIPAEVKRRTEARESFSDVMY